MLKKVISGGDRRKIRGSVESIGDGGCNSYFRGLKSTLDSSTEAVRL